MKGPALLLAILVYVTLDLSLAEMPGAFVFDPAGSVESTHGTRTRGAELVLAEPAPPAKTSPAPTKPAPAAPSVRGALRVPRVLSVVSALPRAVLAPPPSDDAH